MLYQSIFKLDQDHLQNLRWWWRSSIPYLEAKARQESLVAAKEKDLKKHNQLFSEENFVEWAFNTQLAFSPNTIVETLISAFLVPWFLAIASIMTQFWQASIIYKFRWWIWVWNIFTCHPTCLCIWRNCISSGTRCNTSIMLPSDQVGCTSVLNFSLLSR